MYLNAFQHDLIPCLFIPIFHGVIFHYTKRKLYFVDAVGLKNLKFTILLYRTK